MKLVDFVLFLKVKKKKKPILSQELKQFSFSQMHTGSLEYTPCPSYSSRLHNCLSFPSLWGPDALRCDQPARTRYLPSSLQQSTVLVWKPSVSNSEAQQ